MSNLDSNLLIDTPENLVLEAEIAGFGSRFIAALIDYIIIYIALIGLWLLFLRSFTFGQEDNVWGIALFFVIQFTVFFFYHLIFEFSMSGQTLGKRLIGVRVVQSSGMPLTVTSLLIRNFVRLIDFMPIFYGIGLLMFFVTKKTQRLGDLAARTIVIREQKQLSVSALKEDYFVRYFHISRTDVPPDYINLDRLTQQERYTIVNYLNRRTELSNREMIVVPLALRIARMMGIESMSRIYSPRVAETLLEQIARAFELDDQGEWPPVPTVIKPLESLVPDQPIPEPTTEEPTARDWLTANRQYYNAHLPNATSDDDPLPSDAIPDIPLPPNIDPDMPPPPDDIDPDKLPPLDDPDTSWQRFRLD